MEPSTVGVAAANCKKFARVVRGLVVRFAAIGVAYAVNLESIPFIAVLHRGTTINIVFLLNKGLREPHVPSLEDN